MPSKAQHLIEVPEPEPVAATVTVEMRGRRYTFRELEVSEYDKLVKQSTHEEADENGIMQDVTDNSLLMRLMVNKSIAAPAMTPDEINSLGTKLYRAMAQIVNDLHYGTEPVKVIEDKSEAESDGDKETPTPNE